jgi:hypothetical protein
MSHWKRSSALAAGIAIVLGALPMSTAGADSTLVANVEVTAVAFTATGAAKVTATYVCPSGYTVQDGFVSVSQAAPGGRLGRYRRFPKLDFTCDGSGHKLVVRFQTARSGVAFDATRPLVVFVYLGPQNTSGDYVVASDIETETQEASVADIEIRDVEFNRSDAARVTAVYRCPDGFTTEYTLANLKSLSEAGIESKYFARRLVCDGSRHELRVTFETTSQGDPLQPDVPYSVWVEFSGSVRGQGRVTARDLDTRTIQA